MAPAPFAWRERPRLAAAGPAGWLARLHSRRFPKGTAALKARQPPGVLELVDKFLTCHFPACILSRGEKSAKKRESRLKLSSLPPYIVTLSSKLAYNMHRGEKRINREIP